MSDERKRLDSVEILAKSAVDALEMIAEQHIVLARLMAALLADLGADDAGLPARLSQIIDAQGGALSETQREFLANFTGGCGGGDVGEAMLEGVTAH
jgi:hypothetical protein